VGIGTVTTGSYRFNSTRADGNVAFFTDGTSADLFIKTTAGVSTISPTTGILVLGTSSTERLRIDSSGKVGIGESNPDTSLDVVGGSADSVIDTLTLKNDSTGASAGVGLNFVVDGINDVVTSAIYGQRTGSAYHQGSLQFLTKDSAGAGLLERMRIDASGSVLVGTASPAQTLSTNNVLTLKAPTVGNVWGVGPTSSYGNFYISLNGTGVALTGGSTSWGSVSDERQKDIIEPILDAANKVLSLRSVIGKYKTDAVGTRRSFLIAQDVQAVLPEAIDVGEDEESTLSIKYTEVIPLLTAALQEALNKIDALEARLTALEAV